MLAPIVLFVYNRPWHTEQTLDALAANDLSEDSILYIYADGPKEEEKDDDFKAINDVRKLIHKKQWCREVYIVESDFNKGLADSITYGINKVIYQHGKAIILEDDTVTSPGFLKYMNNALEIYRNDEIVMHIGGYIPETSYQQKLPETFFLRFMSCWGWGTWKEAWENVSWDTEHLYREVTKPENLKTFNLDGAINFHTQLEENLKGINKTWAIYWFSSIFLKGGLCLYPRQSLVRNIGVDKSGTNFTTNEHDFYNVELINQVNVERIHLSENPLARQYLKRFYLYGKVSTRCHIFCYRCRSLKSRITNKFRKKI